MKFGKLTDIAGVDFSLPPDPLTNAQVLERRRRSGRGEGLALHVGCTGWGMPAWVGSWYPAGTKSKDFLSRYGQQFNTIELNTTHYRIPDRTMVENWCTSVPAGFRFCPKLHQKISHDRNLGLAGEHLPLFWEALRYFGNQLGACFLQLPPFFGADQQPLLEQFLHHWPSAYPLAVEFRHESWFAAAEQVNQWTDLLAKYAVAAVITDVAGRRDVVHAQLTADFAMIRFVGNGLHPSDYQRIDAWCARLEQWQNEGLAKAYFFPHEPDNLLAPDLVHYLAGQWNVGAEHKIIQPVHYANTPQGGEQISLF